MKSCIFIRSTDLSLSSLFSVVKNLSDGSCKKARFSFAQMRKKCDYLNPVNLFTTRLYWRFDEICIHFAYDYLKMKSDTH